jgi:dihydrofolate reductase
MTMGKAVVMGRKTFESLPNGALPNRRNIVLTRDKNFTADNVEIYHSLNDFSFDDSAFIIGGEQIYKQALPYCKRAYVTKIDAEFEADRFMENLDLHPEWQVESSKKISTQSGIDIEFVTYVKNL